MKRNLISVDLAKHAQQVCEISADGKVLYNRKVTSSELIRRLTEHAPAIVAMEACATAHHWGRKIQALGHEVRLVPAQHAKAFRRVHKSDSHDALAIAEAAQRPGLHWVPIKSVEQQDLQMLGRLRERLSAQRTQVINQTRAFAREYGVAFAVRRRVLMRELPAALEDASNSLSPVARRTLNDLYRELLDLDTRIEHVLNQITELASTQPAYERLRAIPGFGDINAAALLAAIGSGRQFNNARACSAWAGLVPRQHGTGGRMQLGSISKNGDRSLRVLLIHGARAVIRWIDRRHDTLALWLRSLIERRSKNVATVALANKMLRIAWAVLTRDQDYDPKRAFRPQTVN